MMLNFSRVFSQQTLTAGLLTACATAFTTTIYAPPAASQQLLPEAWATVGSVDDLVSYGAGVRFAGTGIEIGTGEEGATGADFLTFASFPVVSPYIGIGYYTGDESVAYSAGAHLSPGTRLVIGGGYHSIRGVNGKLGIRF